MKNKIRRVNFRNLNNKVSIYRVLPNFVTILALCIGFSSIRFALDEKWELAVSCILIGSILDAMDGKIARMLNSTSTFGAELDSLCDAINFGIAPVLVTYLWIFNDYSVKVLSWGSVLLFSICTVLRLARFNTLAFSSQEDKALQNFFIGIPAPAGAILALMPLIFDFDLKDMIGWSFRTHPVIIGIYQAIIAILMASNLPTYSIKNLSIDPKNLWIYLILFGTVSITIFLYTWVLLPILAALYLCSLPYSYSHYKKSIITKLS